MPSFSVQARSDAPPQQVWAVLADARRWHEWTMVRRSSIEREGDPAPDGVGAIRALGTGPFISREEVVVFDPPRHLGYVLLSGMPVRNYRADVTLEPDGDGTRITWASSFAPVLPGTGAFFRWFLRRTVAGFARRLAVRARETPVSDA